MLFSVNKQVAGVPGVTEALFVARQTALAQEKGQSSETPMLYSCGLCGKGYRSSKAHAEHLKSRNHIMRASQGTNNEEEDKAIVKPLPRRVVNKPPPQREVNDEESEESDWEEADPEEDLVGEATKSLTDLNVREVGSDNDMDEDDNDDDYEELDPSSCFMCDLEHDTIESCMVHMHKQHGFFIPDVEYLKDPEGFLTYLGLKVLKHLPKFVLSRNLLLIMQLFSYLVSHPFSLIFSFQVKRDFMCLYCNDRCQPFNGLEAVRKHMVAKSHCKVHFGDGDEEEEAELEDFYDYSSRFLVFLTNWVLLNSLLTIFIAIYVHMPKLDFFWYNYFSGYSYVDEEGKQLVAAGDMDNNVEFGSGGSELIITRRSDEGKSTKTLGSREYMRYYRQKPRPSPLNNMAITAALASRFAFKPHMSALMSIGKTTKITFIRQHNQ